MKELTADINLDEEVSAVASFISLKWTAISNVQALVADIRGAAERIGRPLFDHHTVWLCAKELREERRIMLEQLPGIDSRAGVEYYDAICRLLDSVKNSAQDISNAGREMLGTWDLGARAKALLVTFEERYPDLASARPRGWPELEDGYVDFAGQEEYDPRPDRDLFHGSRVEGTLSDDLPGRLALPHVMHDERCRNRKASVSLVAAVLAHFMGITEFLNSQRIIRALPVAIPDLYERYMLFKLKVRTDNPFLRVAFEMAPAHSSRDDFETVLVNLAAFDALSVEEKARHEAERSASVDRFIESLKGPISPEAQKKREEEKERCATLLSAALNA